MATLAIAPIVSEMAYAGAGSGGTGGKGNGVIGGPTGHDRACENSGAAAHNTHCNGGSTPSGKASASGTANFMPSHQVTNGGTNS